MDRYDEEDRVVRDPDGDEPRAEELDEDAGMIGSEWEEPGPGRDERLTNPDPADWSTEAPTATVGMSEGDPERTRLGAHEVDVGPDDAGMIGSEREEPGPGRDERLTNPDPAEWSTEAPTAPVGMSEDEPEDTRLGSQEIE
jgi:hypothetical protein